MQLACVGAAEPVESLDQLYAAAEACEPNFTVFVNQLASAAGSGVVAKHPPMGLKGRERALKKAQDDYSGDIGRLFDIVRATLVCATAAEATALLDSVRVDDRVAVLKFKNRFANPTVHPFCPPTFSCLNPYVLFSETM